MTVRPSYVVRDRTRDGDPVVLLVQRYEPGTALDRPIPSEAWSASPLDRAAELARGTGVPLVLVTDGQRWTLVWAREGESTGTCTWRAELWLEEPMTLRAFITLLGARRFFALPVEQGLAALLRGERQPPAGGRRPARCAGPPRRRAADRDARPRGSRPPRRAAAGPGERRGLPRRGHGDDATGVPVRRRGATAAADRRSSATTETLAASTLRAQLQERADRDGEDPLERSTAAWHRVLALFRAVHGGIEHDALRLPAYGGGLFDPDRYPFLEGRAPGTGMARAGGAPAAGRRPHDASPARRAADARAGRRARAALLRGARRRTDRPRLRGPARPHRPADHRHRARAVRQASSPSWPLGEIEAWAAAGRGHARRAARQADRPLRQRDRQGARRRARPTTDARGYGPHAATTTHCSTASRRITRCCARTCAATRSCSSPARCSSPRRSTAARPARTTRRASWPRKSSGTRSSRSSYDPGPAQERDPAKWKLKTSAELLDLKVADIAMGSGAFLVAACRYLAARAARGLDRRDRCSRRRRVGDARRRRRGPGRPARARGARPPARRRALPVRRRQEPDGRRDGQALAVADHARPPAAILVRRPRPARRRLAARRHRPAPAPRRAPRPELAPAVEPRPRLPRDRGGRRPRARSAARAGGVRRARSVRRRAEGGAAARGRGGARGRAAARRPRRRRGARRASTTPIR